MHATATDRRQRPPTDRAADAARPAGAPQAAAADTDWLEFLALGLRPDPAILAVGGGWRRAPVLLSY